MPDEVDEPDRLRVLHLRRFRVAVIIGDQVADADGIEYDGKLWIVAEWTLPQPGFIRPALMVRFDDLQHQAPAQGLAHYTVNQPLPAAVLDQHAATLHERLAEDEVRFAIPDDVGPLH